MSVSYTHLTSYFMAELLSLRRILRYAETGEFCYVFIDEILRGTNTVERVAAAQAALEYLAGKNCLVLAAKMCIRDRDMKVFPFF